jgi:iduronate 2-sulfatase
MRRLILFLILCATLHQSLPSLPAAAAQPHLDATSSARPARTCNILFIAIDDLRAELGCYGSDHIVSPNIDKLAATGTLFKRAYCQQAVCNPSRASALTGLRPSTLGIWDLPTHFRKPFPDIVTLPQHFKNHGYHAENIGKIFHNWRQDDFKGDPDSWSVPAVLHYNTHGADKAQVDGELPPDLSDIPKCVIRDVPDDAYFDGRVANRAVHALSRLKKSEQPFFLAVGFWKPHSHFNAPKKYWDLYDREKLPAAINPDPPQDVPDIALHDSREICRDFKDRPNGRPTSSDAKALRHGYFANISYMDAQVGKVIDELDRLGLRENTLIALWSDHGFHLGEHGLWAKTSNFELDARVPLIIATPDHNPGQRTPALAELLDLYPTLVDLAGLPAPEHTLEGRSLTPLLEDPAATVKDAAFTWHPRPAYPPNGTAPDAMGFSMRTDRYRYTEWRDPKTGAILARELYDHQKDPHETQNLANHPEQSPNIKSFQRLLTKTHPPKKG